MDPITITTDTMVNICIGGIILGCLCIPAALAIFKKPRPGLSLCGVGVLVAGGFGFGLDRVNNYEQDKVLAAAVQTLPPEWRAFYNECSQIKNSKTFELATESFTVKCIPSHKNEPGLPGVTEGVMEGGDYVQRICGPVPHSMLSLVQFDLFASLAKEKDADFDESMNPYIEFTLPHYRERAELRDKLASMDNYETRIEAIRLLRDDKAFSLTVVEFDLLVTLAEASDNCDFMRAVNSLSHRLRHSQPEITTIGA